MSDDSISRPVAAEPVTIEVPLTGRTYPVVVGAGWLPRLVEELPLPVSARHALVVSQAPVDDAGHLAPVVEALQAAGLATGVELVPDGEPAKDVSVLERLWQAAARVPLSREDLVVAVGGGVVGDLAGFVAATFNRGIAVLQVPTTLLAQVDAAIGGKTGVNLPQGKNLVGAFHQPVGVACDVATLATLPARVRVEGLGEVVKYGLIRDPAILDTLEADPDAALAGDPEVLAGLVRRSAEVKAVVVASDEREGGERMFLNLGHTYGHALEALTGYQSLLHGEAVAVGMVVALHLGARLGRTPPELVARTERLLERLGLPTRGPALDREAVWEVMGRDKKAGAAGIRFVLLDGLADPVVVVPPERDVDAVLDELAVA